MPIAFELTEASMLFEDCCVPHENLLGERGRGFGNAMQILDGGRISIAALAIGIAQGAFESALKYSKERHQFGQPIAEFQGIQFKLADMATQIDAARLLTLRAASLKDRHLPTTKESAMAKLYASEIGVKVCEEAIRVTPATATPRIIRRRSTGAIPRSVPSAKARAKCSGW